MSAGPRHVEEDVRELAAVATVQRLLAPEITQLLRTDDPDEFADRLLRLDPDAADDTERADLDAAVQAGLAGRPSWWEIGARLGIVVVLSSVVVIGLLVAASWAAEAFHRYFAVSWLGWPPTRRVIVWCIELAVLAVSLGWAVTWLRARDHQRRARLALRIARRQELDHWPGLRVESPFRQAGRVWSYPGAALAVIGVGVPVVLALTDRLTGLAIVIGVACLAMGAFLITRAVPWRRADRLARQTVFATQV